MKNKDVIKAVKNAKKVRIFVGCLEDYVSVSKTEVLKILRLSKTNALSATAYDDGMLYLDTDFSAEE